MELCLSRLAPHGLLLFHASSRYFDFRPVLANLAAHLRLSSLAQFGAEVSDEAQHQGKCPSFWGALACSTQDFGLLREDARWRAVPPLPAVLLWTDDYSNIHNIFQWR